MRKLTPNQIAKTRSGTFAAYLDTLPPEEKRRIKDAERAYVSRRYSTGSRPAAAMRDHLQVCEGGALTRKTFLLP
jgi:hypothetical protein